MFLSNPVNSQTRCNLTNLEKEIQIYMDQDKKESSTIYNLETLTLMVKNSKESNNEAHTVFSFKGGVTFRFYVLSSSLTGNDAVLKLFCRTEEKDEVTLSLLDCVVDKSRDIEPTVLEYKNDKLTDFRLELAFKKNDPGCAITKVTYLISYQ